MRKSGITIIEVMIAVALASSLCAIGFTGITAFSRSITRAKQFVSETELITAAIRASAASADAGSATISYSILLSPVSVPKNWVICTHAPLLGGSQLTFTLPSGMRNQIGNSGQYTTASTTGDVANALKMNTTVPGAPTNTLNIQSLPCQ
jgi:type II secretory pathway pseudopilin PulG